ncbi:hypothetical protein [Aureimonas pseudogalii]|uniref:Uncharacterized protein n=1 Tax=Aureimonas pseudogalii TaxID=1744844 RepID=A0A7W6E8T9_9HYPH|nr:hypothetical protein [Aureimonas pseudogalii]MBB3996876.1 hypothetical protein [Aureimonas pseudogalii]
MAKTANAYDEETIFRVKLMRPVTYRGAPLTALPVHQMTGRALNAIVAQEGADVVDTAEPR